MYFFLHRERPVKHNQIPHAKQRGGRRRPHLLSGVASRKLAENSWLCRWWRRENLGKSHSLSPAQHREGAVWSLQAEKHIRRPPDLVQPLASEMAQEEKAHIFIKSLPCEQSWRWGWGVGVGLSPRVFSLPQVCGRKLRNIH